MGPEGKSMKLIVFTSHNGDELLINPDQIKLIYEDHDAVGQPNGLYVVFGRGHRVQIREIPEALLPSMVAGYA